MAHQPNANERSGDERRVHEPRVHEPRVHEPNTGTRDAFLESPASFDDPRRLAMDPATPVATLRELAHHRDRFVRRAVAANPNTPKDALFALARVFPDAFAQNPILDWLLLDNANWPEELDPLTRIRVLQCPVGPEGTLWWAQRSGSDDDRRAVVMNPNTPEPLLALLERHAPETDVRRSVRARKSAGRRRDRTSRIRDVCRFHGVVGLRSEALALLALSELPTWLCDSLRTGAIETRRVLAAHRSTPRRVLREFLVDDDSDVRTIARANPRLSKKDTDAADAFESKAIVSPDVLRSLATRPTSYARQLAAAHPSVPLDVLDRCVDDSEWRVREAAAGNPSLRDDHAVRLAADTDKDVRAALVANGAVPDRIIDLLRGDSAELVRERLAERSLRRASDPRKDAHHTSIDASGPRETARRAAAADEDANQSTALGELRALSTTYSDGIVLVARHPLITPDEHYAFAKSTDWRVRRAAASNASASEAILRLLATDLDHDVREAVARHPNTPTAVLRDFSTDSHEHVRLVVVERCDRSHPFAVSIRRALVSDDSVAVRVAFASRDDLDDSELHRLATDSEASVRTLVAANPQCPKPDLLRLATDTDPGVRAAILRRPEIDNSVCSALFADDDAASAWIALGSSAEPRTEPKRDANVDGNVDGNVDANSEATVDRAKPRDEQPVALSGLQIAALTRAANWAGALVVHQRANAGLLGSLAQATDWRIREAIAKHPHASPVLVRRLSLDADYDVRCAVARRSDLPLSVIAMLASDAHQNVREAISRHPRTPSGIVAKLYWDEADHVRDRAAEHARLPASARAIHDAVVHLQETSHEILDELIASGPYGKRLAAAHPSLPPNRLAEFAQDADWRIRQQAAAHPACPQEALERLAVDTDRDVRRATAGNRSTPAATVALLLDDADGSVRDAALRHGSLTDDERARVVRRMRSTLQRSVHVVDHLIAVAVHNGPPWELRRVRHRAALSWVVRFALAVNPTTPFDVIQHLARDTNADVRDAAVAEVARRRARGDLLRTMKDEVREWSQAH